MASYDPSSRRLSDIDLGESASIGGYLETAASRRFMALGLVPGASITAIRTAPLGDPIEYEVMGSRVAMRRSDAEGIVVDDPGQ